MNYRPYNLLVTGAAGFIGSNFVRFILNKYDKISVISYDKLTYAGNMDNLKGIANTHNHTFIKGDICNKTLVKKILRKHKIDTIVHFAAESHVDNSIDNPDPFIETNICGTFTLLEAAKQYWEEIKLTAQTCRFHHVSTDEVYGSLKINDAPFSESSNYAPNSPYAASKAASDHLVKAYVHTYQLPATISNASNNYGPNQYSEKLIPVVIKNCLKQKKIPIYGDGTNIRDWVFVEDHCLAIDKIITHGKIGETYNIGGNNELDNLTLVKKICSLMDLFKPEHAPHHKLITFVEDRSGHDWRYSINNSKIEREIGITPSRDFEQLLKKTVSFYLND